MRRIRKILQSEMSDCGLTCLDMICGYYRVELSEEIRKKFYDKCINGCSVYQLQEFANETELSAYTLKIENFSELDKQMFPCIIHIIENGMGHFVVLSKLNKRRVIIFDPQKGRRKETLTNLAGIMSGYVIRFSRNRGKRNNREKSSIGRLIENTKSYKKYTFSAFAFTIFTMILVFAYSRLNQYLYDEYLLDYSQSKFGILFLLFLCVLLFEHLFVFLRNLIISKLSNLVEYDLVSKLFNKLLSFDFVTWINRKVGDVLTRFNDCYKIKDISITIIIKYLFDLCISLFLGTVLFCWNVRLFLLIVISCIISLLVGAVIQKPYKNAREKHIRNVTLMNSSIVHVAENNELIITTNQCNYEAERFKKTVCDALKSDYLTKIFSSVQQFATSFLSQLSSVLVILIAFSENDTGKMSLGRTMAFVTLAGVFVEAVKELVLFPVTYQDASISLKRVDDFMCLKSREHDVGKSIYSGGRIVLNNVSLTLNSSEILHDISLEINPGEKIAFVGASGGGKSSIAKIITGLYTPSSGHIYYGEDMIEDVSTCSISSKVSYLSQNNYIVAGSLLENILYGSSELDMSRLQRVMDITGLYDVKKPQNWSLNRVLEENGKGLSGGQRQRVALARALYKSADIYILDEPTSNMDFLAEHIFFEKLLEYYSDKAIVVISHRINEIRDFDKIYVISDGRIQGKGNHKSLIGNSNLYKKYCYIQNNII